MSKKKEIKNPMLQIVSDGAMSIPDLSEGKLIPVLVLDCRNHQIVHELITFSGGGAGDVTATWGRTRFRTNQVHLVLDFKKPIKTKFTILFNAKEDCNLVDGVHTSKAVYLQSMETGLKIVENLFEEKILVEVSSDLPGWNKIYNRLLYKSYLKGGATKKDAKKFAREHIKHIRKFFTGKFRKNV